MKPSYKHLQKKDYRLYFSVLLLLLIFPKLPFASVFRFGLFMPILYWSFVAFTALYLVPGMHVPGRSYLHRDILLHAGSAAMIQIALHFLLGILLRELKASPYDHSFFGILLNLAAAFSLILAREVIRAFGIGMIWKYNKYRKFFLFLFFLFMTASELGFHKLSFLEGRKEWILFLVNDVLSLSAKNLLLSLFVFYGGFKSGVIYGFLPDAFQKLSPILPELPWLATAVVGIGFPVLYFLFMEESFRYIHQDRKLIASKGGLAYMTAFGISVLFFWFSVGVFELYPSVILTGSMKPMISPGDIVILKKLHSNEELSNLSKGDVIHFRRDDVSITHRIVEIEKDDFGNPLFVTKGDANLSEDVDRVSVSDIKGRMIRVIPKLGSPLLLINTDEDQPFVVGDKGEYLDGERREGAFKEK